MVLPLPEDQQSIANILSRVDHELDAIPKTAAWRIRAAVGDRLSWHEKVEPS
jgi:hypothetical protein